MKIIAYFHCYCFILKKSFYAIVTLTSIKAPLVKLIG